MVVKSDLTTSRSILQSAIRKMPWVGFGTTILFLVLIAVAADKLTTRLESDEEWVSHSQEVERVLGRLRGDLFAAEAARLLYLVSGSEARLAPYYSLSERIPQDISQLELLTADNASQQTQLESLRATISQRDGALKELVELRRSFPSANERQQTDLSVVATLSDKAMAIVQQMRDQEDNLLKQRQTISARTYEWVRTTLAIAFLLVLAVLFVNFRRLWVELRERTQAEESVRKLNVYLLQVQDEERRKVARELHDSIGQIFAALKMTLAMLQGQSTMAPEARSRVFAELNHLLEIGITETRTLSHLLHPPLLDELGFSSAAQWLVDGFSQRSKINVSLEISTELDRMQQQTELVLFRVLQESLTNVHRHSQSKSAEVRVVQKEGTVTLIVRDRGSGMPLSILENFRKSNTGVGVGLTGMRERVVELGGQLRLDSDGSGTVVSVSLPVRPRDPVQSQSAERPGGSPSMSAV